MDNTIETWEPQPNCDLALKPCPFCGGTHVVYEKYLRNVGERWKVWCTECLAEIDPGYAQHKVTVQQMWNRRV